MPAGDYPGKATVIFYKNGSMVELNEKGFPELSTAYGENAPRYMEAELNSPVVSLAPGETYAMDTEWEPIRLKDGPNGSGCGELQRGVDPKGKLPRDGGKPLY